MGSEADWRAACPEIGAGALSKSRRLAHYSDASWLPPPSVFVEFRPPPAIVDSAETIHSGSPLSTSQSCPSRCWHHNHFGIYNHLSDRCHSFRNISPPRQIIYTPQTFIILSSFTSNSTPAPPEWTDGLSKFTFFGLLPDRVLPHRYIIPSSFRYPFLFIVHVERALSSVLLSRWTEARVCDIELCVFTNADERFSLSVNAISAGLIGHGPGC